MVKSYCVKEKKQTNSVPGSEHYVRTKNGRLMLKSICSNCRITKSQFVKQKPGKLNQPVQGAGILDTVASTGTDLLIHHGIPWLGKKAVEMGKYYGSEALRDPNCRRKQLITLSIS